MPVNPLDDLRAAHEGEYFSKRDRELIAQLRQKLTVERATLDIESSGLHDHELAETLAQLGIGRSTIPVLHLVPMIKIGWASGRVEPEERILLEMAARQAGVKDDTAAWTAFQGMLSTRPDQKLYDASLAYIVAMEPQVSRKSLLETARSVADATGGLFGFLGNIESAERDALAEIAVKLGLE
jgi:hypothetical protein